MVETLQTEFLEKQTNRYLIAKQIAVVHVLVFLHEATFAWSTTSP